MAPSEQIVSPPPTDALGKLRNLVAADMEEVNRLIIEFMQSPVALIPELATYIVASGGKRLRPLLTLGAARMCGYQGKDHCRLAAAVEFIHTATLLHDDVVNQQPCGMDKFHRSPQAAMVLDFVPPQPRSTHRQ